MGNSDFLASLRLYHSRFASLLSPPPACPFFGSSTTSSASSFSPSNVSSTSSVLLSSRIASVSSACFTASLNSFFSSLNTFFSSSPGNFIPEVVVDVVVDVDAGGFTGSGGKLSKCSPPLKTIYVTVANDVLLETGSNIFVSL